MSDGWVSITMAKGAPGCETEYGVVSDSTVIRVPVSAAADFLLRSPKDWIITSAPDRAEVNAEITRRSAPITGGGN